VADLPQLPGITVTGVSPVPYDYTAALWYQLQLNEYLARQGATAHDPYVPPGGYGAGAQTPPPKPPAPPPAAEPLELTYNPDTGEMEPPTWAMNDAEYAEYLGGGDAAYEQMWEERHPGEELPGLTDAQPGDPGYDMFQWPEVVPVTPTAVETAVGLLRRLVPWFTPFMPLPAGPQLQDETPLPPRIPPGAPPWFDPIMPPNWNDIAYEPREFEVGKPAPGPVPFGDLQRWGLPIGDTPGLPGDPGLYEKVLPEVPVTSPRNRPTPIADFPLGDPFPWANLVPYPTPQFEPGMPGVFTGIPIPRTATPTKRPPVRIDTDIDIPGWAEPVIRNPRDVARPLPPPYLVTPTLQPDIPVLPDVPLQPFSPLSPPPYRADPCNCNKTKDKKRKKQEPRTVCYEGKFREYSRGTSKFARKRVPCESQNVRPGKRKKAPSMSDLARDVFGLTPFGSI